MLDECLGGTPNEETPENEETELQELPNTGDKPSPATAVPSPPTAVPSTEVPSTEVPSPEPTGKGKERATEGTGKEGQGNSLDENPEAGPSGTKVSPNNKMKEPMIPSSRD